MLQQAEVILRRSAGTRLVWLLPGVVFLVDLTWRQLSPPLILLAVLDESAHLATALLAIAVARLAGLRIAVLPALFAAVFIDADHLPGQWGSELLTRGTYRPYSHSLIAIGGFVLFGLLRTGTARRVALSAAFGIAAHLLRDMATGGVPLLWPLSPGTVRYPYMAYAALLIVAGWLAGRRARPDRPRRAVAPGQPSAAQRKPLS